MLFCENASDDRSTFDDFVVFASQLRAAGLDVRLGSGLVPPQMTQGSLFDAASLVTGDAPGATDRLLLLRGHEIRDQGLVRLRRMNAPAGLRTLVFGRFETFQAQIGLRMKLSYVLGDSPEIHDVPPGLGGGKHHLPVLGVQRARAPRRDSRPAVLFVGPDLGSESQMQALVALSASSAFRMVVLTDGATKEAWIKRFGMGVSVFHYGEILPLEMASLADFALLFGKPQSGYRMQALIANLVVQGTPVADCSPGWAHGSYASSLLQGPGDLNAVATYLASGLLEARAMIGREIAKSRFAGTLDGGDAVAALRTADQPERTQRRSSGERGRQAGEAPEVAQSRPLVFVPTNGVGLGHAQRTSLIAAEIDRAQVRPTFAAFPSCMRMLKGYGFDAMPLVSRSPHHKQEYENDLVNYLRLRALTKGGGTLVFDGGYVFDSIYRSILENRLNGVWIRRGLWQEGQSNTTALDREKVFHRVIVPREAFDEINSDYSAGGHLHQVGPIVQTIRISPDERLRLRADLAARYRREFRHLAVTMLGGGVAADRSAQLSAICAMMATRADTLHLVVVWPTATVEANAFSWPNTRVVKTHHASTLVASADLYVSAVGYNSFHEAMYNRVPTVFMAQMAAYMDDQRARAMAAVSRGLAAIVEPHEMLSLRATITDYLDGGQADEIRHRLAECTLPEPGNVEAARLIMEITECHPNAGAPSCPASPASSPTAWTTSSERTIHGRARQGATSFPTMSA